jgi:hypothetical protein
MVKTATCQAVFKGHCNHWGLTEAAHALLHAQGRLIEEVAAADTASGIDLATAASTTSVADDGPRLEALLLDEGYVVVPAGRAA